MLANILVRVMAACSASPVRLAVVVLSVFAAPAYAQEAPPAHLGKGRAVTQVEAKSGRYTMTPAPNGFLRLDTKTGAVSLCAVSGKRVTCRSSADERAALEAEIARLARRNAELERKLRTASKSTRQRLRELLPSDKEMDKALTFAEQFMRRMMRMMRDDKERPNKI